MSALTREQQKAELFRRARLDVPTTSKKAYLSRAKEDLKVISRAQERRSLLEDLAHPPAALLPPFTDVPTSIEACSGAELEQEDRAFCLDLLHAKLVADDAIGASDIALSS